MTDDQIININKLEHYAYCPRQWGLMEIEAQWQENAFVISGNLVHSRVDNPFDNQTRKEVRISRSMSLYSERYGLLGVADCIEFEKDQNGVLVLELGDKRKIRVVEYKNGKPQEPGKINRYDAVQVAVQMLCVEEMFGALPEGFVFYDKIKRRVKLTNFSELKDSIISMLSQMRDYIDRHAIPKRAGKTSCQACSMEHVCLPKAGREDFFHRLKKREQNL